MSSSDSFQISLLKLFTLKFSKSDTLFTIGDKEKVILRSWSWKKLGYIRKLYYFKDGKLVMEKLT